MATITIVNAGCKEGLLTIGRLNVVQGAHGWYPTATHRLEVDLLPVLSLGPSTGLTFVGPTIEIQISPTVSGSIERWLVPMSSANQPNGWHPEYHDGSGWRSFLDSDPGVPQTAARVRIRRDETSIDWQGNAAAPNGLSFIFGLSMQDTSDPTVDVDDVTFLVQASASQVRAASTSCLRRIADLAVGAGIPGFVPPT